MIGAKPVPFDRLIRGSRRLIGSLSLCLATPGRRPDSIVVGPPKAELGACRCREAWVLTGRVSWAYENDHLSLVRVDAASATSWFVCPETGIQWSREASWFGRWGADPTSLLRRSSGPPGVT
jgi:hypothetical protein